MESSSPLMNRVIKEIRLRHHARSTEKSYTYWVQHFIRYHKYKHPEVMHASEVSEFLTYLAVTRKVSPSTQNQALNALLFLYRNVLREPLENQLDGVRAKEKKLPVVLTANEVRQILLSLNGTYWLVASLLYGSGLRLMEGLRLRVKNIDIDHLCLFVRNSKGNEDRIVTLSKSLVVADGQLLFLFRVSRVFQRVRQRPHL